MPSVIDDPPPTVLDRPPDPTPSAPPWGGAVVRWTIPGRQGEILLDPAQRGPLLVPMARNGASLAAALVEALDRAAEGGADPVEVRRGEAALVLERAPGWPDPFRLPSEVLAGRVAKRTRAVGFSGGALIEQARDALGEDGIALLRAYPRARMGCSAARRRGERAFFRVDEALRAGRRRVPALVGACGACYVAAGFGAALDAGGLAASAALLFALGAGAALVERISRARLENEHGRLRAEIARLVREEEDLEDRARALAARLGAEDPHELADRLAVLEAEEARAMTTEAELHVQRDLARRLAARLGEETPPELEDTARWRVPRTPETTSWPPEVAQVEERSGPQGALVGMARLLVRVERDLPLPWPVVLWEPWVGSSAEERARRLMVLAEFAPGRRVVAFVRA